MHLRSRETDGGDLVLTWIRRGRLDADHWAGIDIPLGEEREEYRIEIAAVGGATVRTATSTMQSYVYSAASVAADFGTLPSAIDVTVRQLSLVAGWGLPATRRFTLVTSDGGLPAECSPSLQELQPMGRTPESASDLGLPSDSSNRRFRHDRHQALVPSRTIWAALVTIAAAGLGLMGVSLGDLDQSALVEALLQAVTAVAGVVALVGRLSARERIR